MSGRYWQVSEWPDLFPNSFALRQAPFAPTPFPFQNLLQSMAANEGTKALQRRSSSPPEKVVAPGAIARARKKIS
jgi:hypothetical protein